MTLTMLVILLLPLALLIILLGFITLNRYIAYKERIALAQMGFSLEDLNRDVTPIRHGHRGVLWGGVITAMSGLALLLGLATIGLGAWLLGGLLPLFVGLGMVWIYFVTPATPREVPPAMSLAPASSDAASGQVGDEEMPFAAQRAEPRAPEMVRPKDRARPER